MKIAINALSARAGGTVSALINLLPEIARIDKNNQYFIFIADKEEEILGTIPPDFVKVKIGFVTCNPYIRIIWEQLLFPIYLIYYKIDVLYSLGNITTLLAPCKIVLLMENSNPYSMPLIKWPWRERLRNELLKLLGWFSAKRADRVRFVSDSSKKLLLEHLKIPIKKCVTIYHGCTLRTDDKEYNSIEKNMPDYNYILTVSIISPHKNIIMLIKAFNILVRQYNYNGRLLLVGDQCYQDYERKLRSLILELNLENKVIFLGKVKHKYIGCYYNRADVFVITSIAETFGMPVIEAMKYSVPVVASDGALTKLKNYFIPFREICGNAAQYVDPFNPEDIAGGIYKIISDKVYKDKLVSEGIMQANKFKWEETAKSLVQVFVECAGKNS